MADTDRELLELAAKAAGIVLGEHARFIGDLPQLWFYNDSRKHPMCRKPSRPGNVPWAPLADDGDALRLAATCHMVLDWSGSELHVRFWLTQSPEAPTLTFKSSDCGGDKATIVRAAAEIGRAMP